MANNGHTKCSLPNNFEEKKIYNDAKMTRCRCIQRNSISTKKSWKLEQLNQSGPWDHYPKKMRKSDIFANGN